MSTSYDPGARVLKLVRQPTRGDGRAEILAVRVIDLADGRATTFFPIQLNGSRGMEYEPAETPADAACDHAPMRLRLDIHDRRGSAVPLDSGTATVRGNRTLLRAVADRVSRAVGKGVLSLELLSRSEHEARYLCTIGTRNDGTPRPDGSFQLAVTEAPT